MYLYLLENSINKIFYIGITDDLNRRLEEHNRKNKHFTGKMRGTWLLIGYKELTESSAKNEERRLKRSKNKKYIEWYFKSKRP